MSAAKITPKEGTPFFLLNEEVLDDKPEASQLGENEQEDIHWGLGVEGTKNGFCVVDVGPSKQFSKIDIFPDGVKFIPEKTEGGWFILKVDKKKKRIILRDGAIIELATEEEVKTELQRRAKGKERE